MMGTTKTPIKRDTIRITERGQKAQALVDIRVLDHVIVGDGITCLSEQGLL